MFTHNSADRIAVCNRHRESERTSFWPGTARRAAYGWGRDDISYRKPLDRAGFDVAATAIVYGSYARESSAKQG